MKNYTRLDSRQINRLIDIFLNSDLDKPIELSVLDRSVTFDSLSEIYDYPDYGDFRYIYEDNKPFQFDNSKKKKKQNGFGFSIGDWGRIVENPNGHIIFHSDLLVNRFDIELGFCLQDHDYIYLAKKMYIRKGRGAMESYATNYNKIYNENYNHLIPETFDKISPFDTLLKVTDGDILNYNNSEWIGLVKIEKSKLFDDKFKSKILYDFIHDITNLLILIEKILKNEKDILIEEFNEKKVNKAKKQILSSEDKKRIELAAMQYVKEKWEQEGFLMTDVSDKRGEEWGYDFEAEAEDGEKYYVEVKGTTVQGDWNIVMTKNEYNASEKHGNNYFLCIVQFDNKNDLKVVNYERIQNPTQKEDLEFQPYSYTVTKK